jgi:hypothetical protein
MFRAIGNIIDTFLDVDEEFLINTSRTMVRVLVDLDLSGGLAEEIEIVVGDRVYV